jgi:hypothetical protein
VWSRQQSQSRTLKSDNAAQNKLITLKMGKN